MPKNQNNNDEFMRVSPGFLKWIEGQKIHQRQSVREVCDNLMQVCKQKGVLEGE